MVRYIPQKEIVLNYLKSGNRLTEKSALDILNIDDLKSTIAELVRDTNIEAATITDSDGERCLSYGIMNDSASMISTIPIASPSHSTISIGNNEYIRVNKTGMLRDFLKNGGVVNSTISQELFGMYGREFTNAITRLRREGLVFCTNPIPGVHDWRRKNYSLVPDSTLLVKKSPTKKRLPVNTTPTRDPIFIQIADFIKNSGPVNTADIVNSLKLRPAVVRGNLSYIKKKYNVQTVYGKASELVKYQIV